MSETECTRPPLPPIVSVVGRSNVGKTTFLEKLIRELKARGWRVGTIKHHPHRVDIDHEGKDTWRHAQAGADVVAIASPYQLGLVRRLEAELSIDQIAVMMSDVDLLITEGFKRGNKPKIEIVRAAISEELVSTPAELWAVVTDASLKLDGVPQYALDDAAGVADLLERRLELQRPATE